MVVPQNRRKYKQANFEETQKSRTTPQRYHYPANQRADRTMGWMCENNGKWIIFLCKHPTFMLCLTCLRWRSEQVACRRDWIKKTFLRGSLYAIFFLFSFIGLIHSVQFTHSEMTFGCQMTTQARSSDIQRSFFVQNRNHFVGLRFCFCIKKTTGTASGNDWRDETGKIIKIKIFNEASVSAGRFLDALDCLKFLIKFLQMQLEIGRLRKTGEFA